MTWVRLDDGFVAHPKVIGLDDRSFRFYISALCYSSQHLTDGSILASQLTFVGDLAGISYPKAFAKKLVLAGLWDEIEGGYRIHDYLKYNSAKVDVERDRAAARDRMARRRGADVRANGSTEVPANVRGEVRGPQDSKEKAFTSREPFARDTAPAPGTPRAAAAAYEASHPWKCPLCQGIRETSERLLREHLENVHWLEGPPLDAEIARAAEGATLPT